MSQRHRWAEPLPPEAELPSEPDPEAEEPGPPIAAAVLGAIAVLVVVGVLFVLV